eukprot:10421223-Alexandrium_andersonii.AAC.1
MARSGAEPSASAPAADHFAHQDEAEREIVRATVARIPDAEARRAVLERDHAPDVVVSDDERSDEPDSDPEDPESRAAMWPAHRRVVEAVQAAADGGREHEARESSSGEEFVPDYGGDTDSEREEEPEDEPSTAARVVRMEVDEDQGFRSRGAESACGPPAPGALPVAPP